MTTQLEGLPAGCVLAGRSGARYRIVTTGVAARCGDDNSGQVWDVADLDAADGPLIVVLDPSADRQAGVGR